MAAAPVRRRWHREPSDKRSPPPREQVTLEFPDNALLAALSGPHQKNFARLEQKLGVRIATRGNLIAGERVREVA